MPRIIIQYRPSLLLKIAYSARKNTAASLVVVRIKYFLVQLPQNILKETKHSKEVTET